MSGDAGNEDEESNSETNRAKPPRKLYDKEEIGPWMRFDYGGRSGPESDEEREYPKSIPLNGRTRFDPSEVESNNVDQYRRFKKLLRWNSGAFDDGRDAEKRTADNHNHIDTFASQLDFPGHWRDECHRLMEAVDNQQFAFCGNRKLALAICCMIANLHYEPLDDDEWSPIQTEEYFNTLMDSLDMESRELNQIRKHLREYTDAI